MRDQDGATIEESAAYRARIATDASLRQLADVPEYAEVRHVFLNELERRATCLRAVAEEIEIGDAAAEFVRRSQPRALVETRAVYHVVRHRDMTGGLLIHQCASPRKRVVVGTDVDVSTLPLDRKDSTPILTSWIFTGHHATGGPTGGQMKSGARVIYGTSDPARCEYVDRIRRRRQRDLRQFGACHGRSITRPRDGALLVEDLSIFGSIYFALVHEQDSDPWSFGAYNRARKKRTPGERYKAIEAFVRAVLARLAPVPHRTRERVMETIAGRSRDPADASGRRGRFQTPRALAVAFAADVLGVHPEVVDDHVARIPAGGSFTINYL